MITTVQYPVGKLIAAGQIAMEAATVPVPGEGEVIIRVHVCGICGTDISFFRYGSAPAGAILGHEFSGVVMAVGKGVPGVREGLHVTVNPMASGVGLGRIPGAFAEFVVLPAAALGRNLFPLPANIGDDIGALVEPFAVGLHAVSRAAAQPHDNVVIFGAGPVGLCVLAALRVRGVKNVLVIDPSPLRRTAALSLGALAVHAPQTGASSAFVAEHFGHEVVSFANRPVAQANIAFDCAGAASVLADGLHSLAIGGRFVIVADPHKLALPDLRLVMLRELSVIGAIGYDTEFAEAIDLIASGAVNLAPLITHRFPLNQLAEAFAMQCDATAAIKVLVDST